MPRGGPRGGGPRGPMGGMPFRGTGPSIYINGQAINRFAPASEGRTLSPSKGPVDDVAVYVGNIKRSIVYSVKKKGILSGTLTGVRHMLTNSLHLGSFNRKLQIAAEDRKKGKITERQFAVRRMRAAGEYYSYLRKIGYFTEKEFDYYMGAFARSIGVDYEDDTLDRGRSI